MLVKNTPQIWFGGCGWLHWKCLNFAESYQCLKGYSLREETVPIDEPITSHIWSLQSDLVGEISHKLQVMDSGWLTESNHLWRNWNHIFSQIAMNTWHYWGIGLFPEYGGHKASAVVNFPALEFLWKESNLETWPWTSLASEVLKELCYRERFSPAQATSAGRVSSCFPYK